MKKLLGTSYNQALTKLRHAQKGYVLPSAVFDWAIKKKKAVDVFINFMYHVHSMIGSVPKEIRDKEKPLESLKLYRKQMHLPNTK